MDETVNQGNNDTRTFTQAEVDTIVRERLSREREKYADYEELREKAGRYDAAEEAAKTELQKATEKATALETELAGMKKAAQIREMREKVASETGIPVSLITAETEEQAAEQAKQILEFARPSGYPSVKDGGEAHASGGSTREQFADWFNHLS